jgi:hypothetical protein
MVIDAQSEQLHGDMTLKRDEKFRQDVLETDRPQTTRRRQGGRTPAATPRSTDYPTRGYRLRQADADLCRAGVRPLQGISSPRPKCGNRLKQVKFRAFVPPGSESARSAL